MDVRLPERALSDPALDALPDAAYRTWVSGLLYIVAQSTDGAIPARALRLLNPDGPREDCAALLVERGLWRVMDDGWTNVHFQAEQTPHAEVERLREQARERQRRHRERQREEQSRVTERVTEADDTPQQRDKPRDGNATSRVTNGPHPHADSEPSDPSGVTVTEPSSRDQRRDGVGEARRGEERRGAVTGTTVLPDAEADDAAGALRLVRDRLGGRPLCDVCGQRAVDVGFRRCGECASPPARTEVAR